MHKKKTSFRRFLPLMLMSLLLAWGGFSSCSTQKDRWINRTYHNVTAYYNAWWNGNESMKAGIKKLEENHKDDYTRLLQIFPWGTEQTATLIKTDMDRAIEKGSKVVKKHSMVFNGKEKCAVVDDGYLLIGKACFFNRDYKSAEATFKHISSVWKNAAPMYDAMLWLAITHMGKGDYSACETMLDQLRNKIAEKKAPKRLEKQLYLVYAENSLKQNKGLQALQYLTLAEDRGIPQKYKARVYFIMGQLFKAEGQNVRAGYFFRRAAAKAHSYEMQFSATLNVAMCYDPLRQDGKDIIAQLLSMAGDTKNKEYRDQIYYALGEVYMRDKNVNKACESWEKSVAMSQNNDLQKIGSSLKLGDTYYDLLEEYEKSQMYFDTALTLMKNDYPDYANIKSKHEILTQLVKHIRTVALQDSVLALSELSLSELDLHINRLIEEHNRAEREKAEAERIAKAEAARLASLPDYARQGRASGWYFYNPVAIQNGKNEFQRLWGNRKNEDLWRLNQKETIATFNEMDTASRDADGNLLNGEDSVARAKEVAAGDPGNKEFYLKNIPFTPEAKTKSHEMIADALLNQGYIFYQGINNYGRALDAFLSLIKRYPGHVNILPAYFHLYRIYDKMGKTPSSNYYKNQILSQYPNSEYAMMIQNPNYWMDIDDGKSGVEKMYNDIYKQFEHKQYAEAARSARILADSLKFGQHVPKLLYLEAVSICKSDGNIDSLILRLSQIMQNHPNHAITPGIEDQLKFLAENKTLVAKNMGYTSASVPQNPNLADNAGGNTIQNTEDTAGSVTSFSLEDEDVLDAESLLYRYRDIEHYYVVIASDDNANTALLNIRTSDFNRKYFSGYELNVSHMLFTLSDQILTVKKFANIQEAMRYYDLINESAEVFSGFKKGQVHQFVISVQNYPTLYNRKNILAYEKFFRIFYLKPREENKTKN